MAATYSLPARLDDRAAVSVSERAKWTMMAHGPASAVSLSNINNERITICQ